MSYFSFGRKFSNVFPVPSTHGSTGWGKSAFYDKIGQEL